MLVSVVVPVFNEAKNLPLLYAELEREFAASPYDFELIFVDDGSTDTSLEVLKKLKRQHSQVSIIELSRNFGKEVAITAGLHAATGEAAIMIDADLQHPVALLPEFLNKWQSGAEVVVGVRKANRGQTLVARFRSWLFYKIMAQIADTPITPNATDYRLIDRVVIDEFNRFTERNRLTRGLIDWLGFRRDYVYFTAERRMHGAAAYSFPRLVRLAIDSFVSMSLFPLKLAGYLGIIITLLSGAMGAFILVEKYLLHDALHMRFSGPAMLAVILMFLVGIVLISLGLMALYIASIHGEVINRPLYVLRRPREHRP